MKTIILAALLLAGLGCNSAATTDVDKTVDLSGVLIDG